MIPPLLNLPEDILISIYAHISVQDLLCLNQVYYLLLSSDLTRLTDSLTRRYVVSSTLLGVQIIYGTISNSTYHWTYHPTPI